MNLGLEGKRALVFGATSGIGRGIAKVLIEEGARVAIAARDTPRLAGAAAALGASAHIVADLDEPDAGTRAVAAATDALGGLDILVTNGGGPTKSAFLDTDGASWERAIQQVLLGAVEPIRAALPAMIEQRWGRILVITSSTGREPLANMTLSNTLRPGLHGLVNSVSKEVAGDGVTINAIMPGMTATPRIAELGLPMDTLTASIPAGRLAEPEELGHLAAFLASERAGYINGQAIACDGARLAGI